MYGFIAWSFHFRERKRLFLRFPQILHLTDHRVFMIKHVYCGIKYCCHHNLQFNIIKSVSDPSNKHHFIHCNKYYTINRFVDIYCVNSTHINCVFINYGYIKIVCLAVSCKCCKTFSL